MRGVTVACLNWVGNVPSLKELLIIEVMGVISTSRPALTSEVGHGSRSHCLSGEALITLRMSASVTMLNFVNVAEFLGGRTG